MVENSCPNGWPWVGSKMTLPRADRELPTDRGTIQRLIGATKTLRGGTTSLQSTVAKARAASFKNISRCLLRHCGPIYGFSV